MSLSNGVLNGESESKIDVTKLKLLVDVEPQAPDEIDPNRPHLVDGDAVPSLSEALKDRPPLRERAKALAERAEARRAEKQRQDAEARRHAQLVADVAAAKPGSLKALAEAAKAERLRQQALNAPPEFKAMRKEEIPHVHASDIEEIAGKIDSRKCPALKEIYGKDSKEAARAAIEFFWEKAQSDPEIAREIRNTSDEELVDLFEQKKAQTLAKLKAEEATKRKAQAGKRFQLPKDFDKLSDAEQNRLMAKWAEIHALKGT